MQEGYSGYYRRPPPDGWVKINVGHVLEALDELDSIAYVMTDHRLRIVMMESKRIGDCDILVTECWVVCEAILKATQKGIQRVIIQSDAHLVMNSINEKTHVPMIL